ncbi:MAG TPA: DUF6728 family protein [Sediminibacterium sp.]|uniref:DUF6728 family protein n=1 Tax=Sediminibacterium sp. TaxID=1917865 RepID=UPI000A8AB399|nr:DUF6728 family protein [Sediminibacterium sp.]HLD52624.1 DUF6728 family protein [Sediminibacterium sp.]
MGIWNQIQQYLFIKKADSNAPKSTWMKYMHGMNRVSLVMFLLAVIFILIKQVVLPMFR